MANKEQYKKRLATASLAEAKAMDKAYADAQAKGLKKYTYKGLEYAVTGTPRVLATDMINKPVTKSVTKSDSGPRPDEDYVTWQKRIGAKETPFQKAVSNIRQTYTEETKGKDYAHTITTLHEDYNTRLARKLAQGDKPVTKPIPQVAKTAPTTTSRPVTKTNVIKPEAKQEDSLIEKALNPAFDYLDEKIGGKKLVNKYVDKIFGDSPSTTTPKPIQKVYPTVANQSKDFYASMDKVKSKAQMDLQQLYPHEKIEVRSHDKKRDAATQAKYAANGASRTELSMHNLGLGEDVGIYRNGKLTDDTKAYQVLGAAAKDSGHFWGWDWDKGHVGATDNVANAMRKNPNIAKEPVVQNFSNQYAKGVVPEKYKTTLHVIDSLAGKPDRNTVSYIGGKGNVVLPDNLLQPVRVNKTAKLAYGGSVSKASPYLQGAAQVTSMIDGMDGNTSTFGGVASGALSGASMGATLGPIGMAAGAVVGGGAALAADYMHQQQEEKARKTYMNNLTDEADMTSKQVLRNYATKGINSGGAYMAEGGKIPKGQEITNDKDLYGNSIVPVIKKDSKVDRSYYDDRLNTMVLGSDYDNYPKDIQNKVLAHENYHAQQYNTGNSNFDIAHNTELATLNKLKKKPSITATDEEYYDYHNRKPIESEIDINNFKKNNKDFQFVSDDAIFDKAVDASQYENPESLEGEARYYEDTGKDYNTGKKRLALGGDLENDVISKVLMNRNRNLNFVDRAINPNTAPQTYMEAEGSSQDRMTHRMATGSDDRGNTYMFPTLVPNGNHLETSTPNSGYYREAIKLPGRDANMHEYISSVGYKKAAAELGNRKEFALGGIPNPDYEVEKGEVVQGQPMLEEGQQVASDMHVVGGEKHENGGTDGVGGDRVFSDRLKPVRGGKTYASIAEKLGKQKGKFEEKSESTNEATRNTGQRMTERIDKNLDELFNEQEMKKAKKYANAPSFSSSSSPKMAAGGTMPKIPDLEPVLNIDGKPLYYDEFNHKGMYGNYEGTLANPNAQYFRAGQPGNKYPYPTVYNPDDKRWYAHQPSVEPLTTRTANLNMGLYNGNANVAPTEVKKINDDLIDIGGGKKPKGDFPWQYIDNLANGIATANTPQIAKPYLDPAVKLNTQFDINPQLSSARNTRDAVMKSIDANTVQSGAASGNKQQLYATYNENANNLYAQKNNVENELKNKEILLNSGINSRNNDKRYAYDVQNTERRAGIADDYVNNARNFERDQYTSARDAKTDARDLENIKQLAMANPNGADYAYKLKAYKDMYANNPQGLKTQIEFMRSTTPNSAALAELEKYYATLAK